MGVCGGWDLGGGGGGGLVFDPKPTGARGEVSKDAIRIGWPSQEGHGCSVTNSRSLLTLRVDYTSRLRKSMPLGIWGCQAVLL